MAPSTGRNRRAVCQSGAPHGAACQSLEIGAKLCSDRGDGARVLDAFLDALADQLAPRLADRLAGIAPPPSSPWLTVEEAADYTKIPLGTFRKMSAEATFKSHGGKRKVYHRAELDEALGQV